MRESKETDIETKHPPPPQKKRSINKETVQWREFSLGVIG